MKLSADKVLSDACENLGISLQDLVATSSLWANPEVYRSLSDEDGCWYPNRRRFKKGSGEEKGQEVNGVYLDDNTYPNYGIKRAIGYQHNELSGFAVCHIWPGTTYDPRYHTCVANLVILPAPLASLTDHLQIVENSMKYRAYELYGWHPAEMEPPQRPFGYPVAWRDPMPFNDRVKGFIKRRRNRN